jgi:DNA-binding NarL/FixJ family response regulator
MTRRQRDVIALVARGASDKDIAAALGLAYGTVKVYLARIYEDLGIGGTGNNRVKLALYAVRSRYE